MGGGDRSPTSLVRQPYVSNTMGRTVVATTLLPYDNGQTTTPLLSLPTFLTGPSLPGVPGTEGTRVTRLLRPK